MVKYSQMQQQKQAAFSGAYDAGTIGREIVDVAVDKKASDVSLLDIHELTTLADYFVLATGTSDRQIRAVSVAVQERMDEVEVVLLRSEGMPSDGWVLLDYGQVIVHIFAPEERAYYDLERRWKEAPTLLKIQ
jgi:ribosome-associated protein